MNHKIKIVKRSDRKESEPNRLEQSSNPTREISVTIKLWVSEFKKRQRATVLPDPH